MLPALVSPESICSVLSNGLALRLQPVEAKMELGLRLRFPVVSYDAVLWYSCLNCLGLLPLRVCFQKQRLLNHMVPDEL